MRKIDKIKNEKFYIEILEQWLLKRGYYNHYSNSDKTEAYDFMYNTFQLSWHKTQKLIFKKISKKILDELEY